MPNDPPLADPEGADRVISQGRALVRAIEAPATIEPSDDSERASARLLMRDRKRRLRAVIAADPPRVDEGTLGASEGIPDPRAALFWENRGMSAAGGSAVSLAESSP